MNTVVIRFSKADLVCLCLALSACTGGPPIDQTSERPVVPPGVTPVSSLPDLVENRHIKFGEKPPLLPAAEKSDESVLPSSGKAVLNPPISPSSTPLPSSIKKSVLSETAPNPAVPTAVSTEGDKVKALPPLALENTGTGEDVITIFPEVTAPPLNFREVLNSSLWQKIGGSDILTTYTSGSLVYLSQHLKRMPGEVRNQWSFLCEDAFCSKGIRDVNDLSRKDVIQAIHRLGQTDETYYMKEEGTLVLQEGIKTQREARNFVELINTQVLPNGLERVLVNMSHPWTDTDLVFYVGSLIQQSEADLHIIGQCSLYCVYLIPAAKKVIIEPSGYIAYNGGHAETYMETIRMMDSNTAKLQEQFHQTYFSQGAREGFKDLFNNENLNFVDSFLGFPSAVNAVNQFLSRHLRDSFEELSKDERNIFVNGLPTETLSKMQVQAFQLSDHHKAVITTKKVASHQKALAEKERRYYEKLNISPKEEGGYFYPELVNVITRMVRLDLYEEEFFVVNRMSSDVPESEKPLAVLPSAKILRQAGINIYGKNDGEVLYSLYSDAKESFLRLDTEDIENCKLFSSPSYIMKDMQNCITKNDKPRLEAEEDGEAPPPIHQAATAAVEALSQ